MGLFELGEEHDTGLWEEANIVDDGAYIEASDFD